MSPRKSTPAELLDYRSEDWSGYDFSSFRPREQRKFQQAILALADPAVADGTFRLINFGDFMSDRSRREFPAETWLMAAHHAATVLGSTMQNA